MVGGLVQEQGLGCGEEDPRQLDTPALAARQGAQRLAEDAVGQPEVGTDPGGFALGGISPQGGEPVLQVPVPADSRISLRTVSVLGHGDLSLG